MRPADSILDEIATEASEQALAERYTRDDRMKAAGRGEAVALATQATCHLCLYATQGRSDGGVAAAKKGDDLFWEHDTRDGRLTCSATFIWAAIEKAGWSR